MLSNKTKLIKWIICINYILLALLFIGSFYGTAKSEYEAVSISGNAKSNTFGELMTVKFANKSQYTNASHTALDNITPCESNYKIVTKIEADQQKITFDIDVAQDTACGYLKIIKNDTDVYKYPIYIIQNDTETLSYIKSNDCWYRIKTDTSQITLSPTDVIDYGKELKYIDFPSIYADQYPFYVNEIHPEHMSIKAIEFCCQEHLSAIDCSDITRENLNESIHKKNNVIIYSVLNYLIENDEKVTMSHQFKAQGHKFSCTNPNISNTIDVVAIDNIMVDLLKCEVSVDE